MPPAPRTPALRRAVGAGAVVVALVGAGAAATIPAAGAGVRTHSLARTNPLAHRPWGVYRGHLEPLWTAYRHTHGTTRSLLGVIARQPNVHTFGAWNDNATVARTVHQYIRETQHGNPNTLVQMAIYRVVPWSHRLCHRLPTPAERTSYFAWTNRVARAIHHAHVALILQPDLPFANCAPNHSRMPLNMLAYAAKRYSQQPNTSVYIDAGSVDWSPPYRAAKLLHAAGVRYARGFALNVTHYASTVSEIRFGTQVLNELHHWGIYRKHFVVNTSGNGRPFDYNDFHGSDWNNAATCRTRAQHRCVTLGIPPTWRVAQARWRLPAHARHLAANHVDGYLWAGRPWETDQSKGLSMYRALSVARTTPW